MIRVSTPRIGLFGLGLFTAAALAVPVLAGPAAPTPAALPAGPSLQPIVPTPVSAVAFNGDVRGLPRVKPRQLDRPELQDPALQPGGSGPTAGTPAGGGGIAAPAPSPSTSFAGLDLTNWGAGWPPDTNGDVGPNHYIETVNTSIGIYGKTGTQLAAFTFDTLFSGTGTPCDANNGGDPVVIYDALANRWIIADLAWSNFSKGPFYECFAASKTSDPVSGGWWLYAFQTDPGANLGDYPKFGLWPDGLYMSANEYSTKGIGQFKNVRVWAFNRTDMESGAALRSVRFDLAKTINGDTIFAALPSNLRGTSPPAGRPNIFSVIWGANVAHEFKFHVDWTTPANSTFTGPDEVALTAWTVAPSSVPELNGNALDTLYERVMMQAQYRNLGGQESIWLTHTVGDGSGNAAVRWYQINVTGGTVQTSGPMQYGLLDAADSTNRFMPSLAVDGSGDMALGYSVSSSSMYPAIRYSGRLYSDPAGQLPQTEQTLINGGGAQTNTCGGSACGRWGDYSAMTVDPSDNCTFWYTNEYYATSGGDWQTRIGSFKFPSCTGSPPATTTSSSTSTTTTTPTTTTTTVPTTTTTTTTVPTSTTTTTTANTTSTTTSASSYASTVLGTSGLVSYWRLGEASGTTAADSKGTNTGTYVGSPTLGVAGAIVGDTNTAVTLNGSSQYVNAPSMTLGQISLEAWVKTSAWLGNSAIAGDWSGSIGAMLYVKDSTHLALYLNNTFTIVATAPSTGAWHHVVGTFDGTSGRLYIDGVLAAGPTAATVGSQSSPFEIGTYGNAAGGKFGGTIDEVAVYNRALSAAEIASHFSIGTTGH